MVQEGPICKGSKMLKLATRNSIFHSFDVIDVRTAEFIFIH